eukprot:11919339-Ditylum_brightwellii.AAC.1
MQQPLKDCNLTLICSSLGCVFLFGKEASTASRHDVQHHFLLHYGGYRTANLVGTAEEDSDYISSKKARYDFCTKSLNHIK